MASTYAAEAEASQGDELVMWAYYVIASLLDDLPRNYTVAELWDNYDKGTLFFLVREARDTARAARLTRAAEQKAARGQVGFV